MNVVAPRPLAPVPSAFERDEQARIRAVLSRCAVFRELPPDVIDELGRRVAVRRVPGGRPVLGVEQAGEAFYVLMAGRVKAVISGENGREVTLAVLRSGDFFGEMALFDGRTRTADVVAIDPATVLVLAREDLLRQLAGHPQAVLGLLGELARRLRRADETIAELALCGVEDRLVRRLVRLAREDATELPEGFLIRRRPTQQDLASMVGSCRETISRALGTLARRGLILARGRAMIVSRRLLAAAEAPARAG